jgi:hypothetical protein
MKKNLKKNLYQDWTDLNGIYKTPSEAFEDTSSVHLYLCDDLYIHPCGQMDEESFCACKKCMVVMKEVGEQ